LQPCNVDINASLFDIARLLRPTLGEHIQVDSILEKGAPTALIDPSQLASALLNLAINARDAMPNGGKLMLENRKRRAGCRLCAKTMRMSARAPM